MEQYLTFQLARQSYGVQILSVQEIRGWERPTRLPHSRAYVQGVINLRGAVVPIIDLRRRFGLDEVPHGRNTVVIVVTVDSARGEVTAGIVVDAVSEVCTVGDQDLRPAPPLGSGIESDLVQGLAVAGDGMLVLLDVAQLVVRALADPAAAARDTCPRQRHPSRSPWARRCRFVRSAPARHGSTRYWRPAVASWTSASSRAWIPPACSCCWPPRWRHAAVD
jgi:purine-binding chemotaxis protein CheW